MEVTARCEVLLLKSRKLVERSTRLVLRGHLLRERIGPGQHSDPDKN